MIIEYIGCIICGIPKEKAYTDRCRLDAAIHGIKLMDSVYIDQHYWTVIKEVQDWFGKGVMPYE